MAAAGLAATGLVGFLSGDIPTVPAVAAVLLAGLLAALARRRPAWDERLLLVALGGLAVLLALAAVFSFAVGVVALVALLGSVAGALRRLRRERDQAVRRRDESAVQLDRRISELFSLQELSFILSESIQVERIVEQVARYAQRFLQAGGAAVVLRDGEHAPLRIVAAAGGLERFQGTQLAPERGALVRQAISEDRIRVMQGVAVPSVELFEGAVVRSAAVAPLRAHGVTLGALAVVDSHRAAFTTEDLWLLSTVATQTSVVLANGRLFEMVRRSKEEWETAFDALAEGIAVVDAAGRIARANRALMHLLPGASDETALLGADFAELLFRDAPGPRELIAAARRGERSAPLVVRSDPIGRVLRLTAAPLTRPEAEGPAVVMLVEDVTEQRALEAQLIQNEKMASIGQLVSGVAHELNNPLTSIAGLAEFLLEQGTANSREHLRVIHDQAERAGRIVRNLLTFARKGAPEKEAVDLNDVVARTALLISYEMRFRGVEIEQELSGDPVVIHGDRYELQQVLLNLVTNAAHALQELPAGRRRVIALSVARRGDVVHLSVDDAGPGVPPDLVPYLFTPFFTTKGPGQGTGLGLSLSYGIIESHGGRLSYGTSPLGGARFEIQLPAFAGSDTAAGATPRLPRAAANGTRGRVLVVDDDPAVHRAAGALFGSQGHEVEITRSGEHALGLLAGTDYALILADARMTAAGDSFVAELLAARPDLRDRLIVAGGGSADLLPGTPVRRVSKPLDIRRLRDLAGQVLTPSD